jgi:hypothetical protein
VKLLYLGTSASRLTVHTLISTEAAPENQYAKVLEINYQVEQALKHLACLGGADARRMLDCSREKLELEIVDSNT